MKIKVKGEDGYSIKASVQNKKKPIWLVVVVNILVVYGVYCTHSIDDYIRMVGIVIGANMFILYYLSEQIVKERVQWERKKRNGKKVKVFFDHTKVRDLVIAEVLTPFQVKNQVILICDRMVTLFERFGLSSEEMMKIYYPVRHMLKVMN